MVPKPSNVGSIQRIGVTRLPAISKLRVKQPNKKEVNPCIGVMNSVLGCWASSGHTAAGCVALEQQLRMCLDSKQPPSSQKSQVNYHLNRFYKRVMGPQKK